MKRILIITTAFVLSLFAALSAAAQDNGVNSPFSRYGIGRLSNQAQGFNQGMAGLAYGMRDGRELNFKNPASYSAIDSLSFLFDMGFSGQNGNFDAGSEAINAKNASFDYLSMGFRINKGFGVSLGVMPISNIGYKITQTGDPFEYSSTGDITPTFTYNGTGGLHEVYGGFGYAPIKQLSFGVNGSYVWGTMTHYIKNAYSDSYVQSMTRTYSSYIQTYKVNFGLQWAQKLGRKNSFVLGATYTLGHDIPGDSYFYNIRSNSTSTSTAAADTLVAKKAWSLPQTIGAGLTWKYKKSLRIGVDYTFQQWSSAKQPVLTTLSNGVMKYEGTTAGYKDNHTVTVGVEYVKDPEGYSWASRVRYRAGFSYSTPYTDIDGQAGPKDYLASVGAAFPIINVHSNRCFLNAAFQFERVQPQASNHLTETYLRFCLGITFNERWFMKWKVQ